MIISHPSLDAHQARGGAVRPRLGGRFTGWLSRSWLFLGYAAISLGTAAQLVLVPTAVVAQDPLGSEPSFTLVALALVSVLSLVPVYWITVRTERTERSG